MCDPAWLSIPLGGIGILGLLLSEWLEEQEVGNSNTFNPAIEISRFYRDCGRWRFKLPQKKRIADLRLLNLLQPLPMVFILDIPIESFALALDCS